MNHRLTKYLFFPALLFTIAMIKNNTPVWADDALSPLDDTPRLRIHRLKELDFGEFSLGKTGGSIIMNPVTKHRSSQGDVTFFNHDYHPASYQIRGKPGQAFRLSIPHQVTLNHQDMEHGRTLHINKLTAYPDDPVLRMEDNGIMTIYVGGTLKANGRVSPGHYRSVFDVGIIAED